MRTGLTLLLLLLRGVAAPPQPPQDQLPQRGKPVRGARPRQLAQLPVPGQEG